MMPSIKPYLLQHTSPSGPGDARPTAVQVIHDQHLLNALQNTKILITGGTSGIGLETARALYLTGAEIYITARDVAKGAAVAEQLSTDPARPVRVIEMALDSFNSVRKGAGDFLSQSSTLNILICNAGIMACPLSLTADGHELQFGTNHLGHFLLFNQLKDALIAGARSSHQSSRVISVSSTGHRMIPNLNFHDLNFQHTEYSPWLAYANSKLANIYFANELDRCCKDQHIRAFSLHPGSIETPLQRFVQDDPRFENAMRDLAYQAQRKSTQQGAATSAWAAVGRELEDRGGLYLEDVGEAGPWEPGTPSYAPGYSSVAFNPEAEGKLWDVSERMCGV